MEFLNQAWPENDAVLQELLALRREHAPLLGYEDWPDYDAEVKMIGTGAAIAEFIDRIADAALRPAERDLAVLLDRMRQDDPEATGVYNADTGYYGEVVRREQFDVDAQRGAHVLRLRQGARAASSTSPASSSGSSTRPVEDAVWHPDVAAYDVFGRDGEPDLGRIYLDMHPREGKYKHAAQFDLVRGRRGRQLPEGVLVCNFPQRR